MKSRIKVASFMLLCAMLLSFVRGAVPHSEASARATCDWAQFVSDVTVPDGTIFQPGATFTKTWRLKNIGTCTWSTSYTMVYVSGTQMGSTTSVNLPGSVAPGQTVDVSVPMTLPIRPVTILDTGNSKTELYIGQVEDMADAILFGKNSLVSLMIAVPTSL